MRSIEYFFASFGKKKYSNKKACEKVKRNVMFNDTTKGGLNMVNIHKYQNSILLGWAEKLISEIPTIWKDNAQHFFWKVGGVQAFRSKTSSRDFKGADRIKSSFWRSVLLNWLDQAGNKNPQFVNITDPIFNNDLVKYGSKHIFFEDCIEKGIITLQDLFCSGSIISFEVFEQKYGQLSRCFLII